MARLGPEINSRAYLCVPQGPRHSARCCFPIQLLTFLLMFWLEAPPKGSGPMNRWPESLLVSLSAISFPLTPACPVTQNSPTTCRAEMSFNACWHCCTKGDDVLAACNAFKTACLSEQILTYFSGQSWVSISETQAKIAYTSAWKTVASLPRRILSLLFTDCPWSPPQSPPLSWTHPCIRRALWPWEESQDSWPIPL
jgi:hypothetical protein